MSAILGFTLLGAVIGVLGGWVTGAVLYNNFFNKLLRVCTLSTTLGLAVGLYGFIWLGPIGLLGLLTGLPFAYIARLWIRVIEPKMRPWDANPKTREDSDNSNDESSIQGPFSIFGAICGGGFGLLGSMFCGFWVALFVSTIVAALAAMFSYGVILTFIMLVDISGFLVPIFWVHLCAFVSTLMDIFFSVADAVRDFFGWLTSIGNRIGDKVNDEDKRIDGDDR